MEKTDSNGKWIIKNGYKILVEPTSEYIEKMNNPIPHQNLVINNDIANAYEAIANLFEMNMELIQRLEVLENGL